MSAQAAVIVRFVYVGSGLDAHAVAEELRRTDFDVECEVAADAEMLAAALRKNAYDAVVVDETLAGWTWREALAVVRDAGDDLPVILVSGTSGDERAVDAMRAGASDYVLKDSVARLGAVLEREIREAATRRERAHLYTELRQNKERFRSTFEKAPIGIANVGPAGRFLSINEHLGTMLGYTRRELIGRHFTDIIHPDDVDDAEARYGAFLAGSRGTTEHEQRLLHKDGRTVWARITLSAVFGDHGELEQIIAVAQDVTESRRIEEELRRFALRQSAAANLGHLGLSGASLETMFGQAASLIRDVLQADFCEVVKAERDGRFIVVAGSGWEPGVVGSERPSGPRSLVALTRREQSAIVVADVTADPRFTPAKVLLQHGARGAAVVPIATTGELWGVLGAYARVERTFSDSDVDFLRTVATMLGQAIERIRAEVELRIRAVQQSAIAELGQIAFSTVDEHTLRRACELAQNGLGVEYALVHERVAGELVVRAGEVWTDAIDERTPATAGSQSAMTAATRVPVVVNDYQVDSRFRKNVREQTERAGVRSGISVPIHGARIFYGVFSVYSGEPRSYTEGDIHFMQSLANTLAEAIEREEATSALVKSEQRYRSVVEGASEIIFEVDRDGVIRSLNRAFESITGYLREDFIGRPLRELVEDGERAAAMLEQMARTRQPVQWETPAACADGSRVVLEINSVPKERNGEVVSMHGFARDVTEARRTGQERQQLTANLQLLLESTAEGIFAIDVDGRCQLVNRAAARMLQRGDDELLGRDMHELTHGAATHARGECPLLEVARTETTIVAADDTFQRADGSPFPVEYSAAPLIDQGRTVGVVVTFTDITERRKLEAKLEQANRVSSLGRLAATVAHEFNNVLMGIAPFVEVIRRTTARDRIEASLGQIALSVARGKRITSEILRFTQPAEPVRTAVDVGPWLRALATEARSILPVAVVLDVASQEGIAIHADAGQIHQTLMNLIVNARDAMPGGGMLTIRAVREREEATFPFGRIEQPERFVHLTVSDNGTGMSAEIRRHIFEPLFTTKKSGTGLGLPLAHQIVTRHGGEIFVESTAGHGTTFHVFLPACEPAPRPAAVPPPPPPPSPRTNYRRILLVEDDAAVAAGIVSVLEMEGLEVDIVDNGTDAIETIRAKTPDVVVLDVGLPDMEGTAVYDAIAETHAGLPVIFSTGHADESRLEEYLARPRVSYLLKPYDAEALLKAIEKVGSDRA